MNYKDVTFNTWVAGKDSAALTFGQNEPDSVVENCIIDGNGAEWGLKMPLNTGSSFLGCTLRNGTERATDIVRGGGFKFNNCVWESGKDRKVIDSKYSFYKRCDIGIKGGASNIEFTDCVFNDMLLGDHCIYDNPVPSLPWQSGASPKCRNLVLTNCKSPTGRPIILRVLHSELPRLVNTSAVALVYTTLGVSIYFWVAGKWIDSRTQP